MLGYGRTRNRERISDLPGSQLAGPSEAENGAAGGMSKGAELGVDHAS